MVEKIFQDNNNYLSLCEKLETFLLHKLRLDVINEKIVEIFKTTDNTIYTNNIINKFISDSTHQNNILDKVAKIIDEFSSELSTKIHINEDLLNQTATKTGKLF